MATLNSVDVGLTASTTRGAPSFGRALLPLLALALAMVVAFMVLGSFGTVQEGAKAELRLSDYRLSLIQGVGAAVPLVLFSIPIGVLVDRARRVPVLIALALVWTAGTALTAVAGGFGTLFVARMLTGIGATGALTVVLQRHRDLGHAIADRDSDTAVALMDAHFDSSIGEIL